MFISAQFMGPGRTPEPASLSSAAEAHEGWPLESSAQILDPGMQTRTDHIHVSSNLVTKGMVIGAGIDNSQVIFTGTDHSPCVVSLDMSQHNFERIEWHKGQPVKDLLNTAINEKKALTALSVARFWGCWARNGGDTWPDYD